MMMVDRVQATGTSRVRKRKAGGQDNNERLSKRLSLLNLEHSDHKPYVSVEQPPVTPASTSQPKPRTLETGGDVMPLDDTKHKVYIYDLEAELSDSSESDENKLVFLPDIEKQIRDWRLPPSIPANGGGQLAANNQLVLYNVPRSLSIPEDQDSVRKAIVEARARVRAKQDRTPTITPGSQLVGNPTSRSIIDRDNWYLHAAAANGNGPASPMQTEVKEQEPLLLVNDAITQDPDAMDLG